MLAFPVVEIAVWTDMNFAMSVRKSVSPRPLPVSLPGLFFTDHNRITRIRNGIHGTVVNNFKLIGGEAGLVCDFGRQKWRRLVEVGRELIPIFFRIQEKGKDPIPRVIQF